MAKRNASPLKSWLPEANKSTADFPLSHLPYGAFDYEGQHHLCVAIGSFCTVTPQMGTPSLWYALMNFA